MFHNVQDFIGTLATSLRNKDSESQAEDLLGVPHCFCVASSDKIDSALSSQATKKHPYLSYIATSKGANPTKFSPDNLDVK